MAAKNWAFGFQVYGKLLRANYYAIEYNPTLNFFHGDMVGVAGEVYLTPKHGYLPGVYTGAVMDSLDNIIGAILSIFDENFEPVKYILASEQGNGAIAGYALVADHPSQQFVGREDFDGGAIDATDGSLNADIINEGYSLPSVTVKKNAGISSQMIDSSTVHSSADRCLKLYGPHPNDGALVADDTPGATSDEGCRYICQITQHYYGRPSKVGGISLDD